MPFRPPALDDRSFEDLVTDLIRRVPAHTPEWTQVREGDPGRTLIDLFAWLGDTILYRANLIPERQRLAFLRLLGVGMRPAVPARGMIQLSVADPAAVAPVNLPLYCQIEKPLPFETLSEVTVHAIEVRCFIKRTPTADEDRNLRDLLPDLGELYGISGIPRGYVTTPIFVSQGSGTAAPVDIVAEARDKCLWFALLAGTPAPAQIAALHAELGGGAENRRRVCIVGL